jgi:hypothetical protein
MGLSRSAIVLRREIVQLRRFVVGVIQSSGGLTPTVINSLADRFDCRPSMIYEDARAVEQKPKYGQRGSGNSPNLANLRSRGEEQAPN